MIARLLGKTRQIIMQELSKFNFKINPTQIGLEKYMSFRINNKLSFIESFYVLYQIAYLKTYTKMILSI